MQTQPPTQKIELDTDIKQFEDQYQMTSAEFYQRFHTGELGDNVDFVEWNALYQMSNSLQEQIKLESLITNHNLETQLSEASFAQVWNNPEDADYDNL